MGGGSYYRDVEPESRSTRRERFNFQGHTAPATLPDQPVRKVCHPLMDPKGGRGVRECMDSPEHPETTAIVLVFDVSNSHLEDIYIVDEKLPMLIGQLILQGFVRDPALSFAGVGDASSGDSAPIQTGQFEADRKLDDELVNIWREGGGGATGQESYELMAYYYARHSVLDCNKRGKKGFLFFWGDEGFYPFVYKDQVKAWIGDDLTSDIPSSQIFKELQEKYHVFFIFPQKTWEVRKKEIDSEFRSRVEAAGGQFSDVDIRATLTWGNRNDLDLHVITPRGVHIYYGDKKAPCGGWLDVDMNVHGETTKPVENIRWEKGKAQPGRYRVYVQNYAHHEASRAGTPFEVQIEINGNIHYFSTTTRAGLTGEESNVPILDFVFDPSERPGEQKAEDIYPDYAPEKIISQWASVIPQANILLLESERAVIDAMTGAIVITNGTLNLPGFIEHLRSIGQTPERLDDVGQALAPLASRVSAPKVEIAESILRGSGEVRGGRTKRF